jgi:hypothetical protein
MKFGGAISTSNPWSDLFRNFGGDHGCHIA